MTGRIKKNLSLVASYALLVISLLFTGYALFLLLIPSSLDLLTLGEEDRESFFYSYIPNGVSLERDKEDQTLMVSLEPGEKDQWVGWVLSMVRAVPEWAELRMTLTEMDRLQAININLIERDISLPYQQREYWYHTLTVRQEETQEFRIPLDQFTFNNGYQPNPYGVNEILELEQGFILEMNIPPQIHNETIRYRIQSLSLRWKNQALLSFLAGLLWAGVILRIIRKFHSEIHQGSDREPRDFYNRALMGTFMLLLFSAPQLFSEFSPPGWLWLVPLVFATVQAGYQLLKSPFWEYHFFLYPTLFLLMRGQVDLFPPFLLLIYLPFMFKSLRQKIIPLILYPLILYIWSLQSETEPHWISYFLILLPLGVDIAWMIFLRDKELQEQRDISTQLLNAVLTNAEEAILLATEEGKIVSYNRGFLFWLGLEDCSGLTGKDIEAILPAGFDRQWFHFDEENSREVELKRGGGIHHYMIRSYRVLQRENLIMQWYITDISETYQLRKELEKANQELEILAVEDELTGLYNRRYFNREMDKEWNRCVRTGTPMTLALADVDFFKPYNDHYGHQKGDDVLKLVGEIWKMGARRSYDVAVRIGGEEFLLLLPDAEAESVRSVLNEIQHALRILNIPHEFSEVSKRLTLSIGVCSTYPKKDMKWQKLLEEADKNMYKAKSDGRNRIIYCSNPKGGFFSQDKQNSIEENLEPDIPPAEE